MTHSPPAVCSTSWSPRSWTRAVGFRRRWCELLRQGSCPGGVAGASGGRKGTSGAGSRAVVAAILSPVSSAAGCAVEWPASMGTAEDGGSSGACIGPGLRSASTVGGRGRTGRPARVADRGARRGVAGGDSGRAAEGDRAGTPEGDGPVPRSRRTAPGTTPEAPRPPLRREDQRRALRRAGSRPHHAAPLTRNRAGRDRPTAAGAERDRPGVRGRRPPSRRPRHRGDLGGSRREGALDHRLRPPRRHPLLPGSPGSQGLGSAPDERKPPGGGAHRRL